MGQLIRATCEICEFENEFTFGAGMQDFETNCSMPAIDKNSNSFVIENRLNRDKLPANIVFYDDKEISYGNFEESFLEWTKFKLAETQNYCPGCANYTMKFKSIAFVD